MTTAETSKSLAAKLKQRIELVHISKKHPELSKIYTVEMTIKEAKEVIAVLESSSESLTGLKEANLALMRLWISFWQSADKRGMKTTSFRNDVMDAHKESFDRIIDKHPEWRIEEREQASK